MSTCRTAAGAKQGRTKGNNTGKLSKQNRKEGTGNQAGNKGKNLESESGTGAPEKPPVRRKREESGKGRTDG